MKIIKSSLNKKNPNLFGEKEELEKKSGEFGGIFKGFYARIM